MINEKISKKFIKGYDDDNSTECRGNALKFSAGLSMCLNIFLTLIKFIVGYFSGSVAIISDGLNNLTDSASTIVSVIAFKFAEHPEDDEHPYGHARYEYLAGVIVAVLTIVISIELFQSSVINIRRPKEVSFGIYSIVVLLISIMIKTFMFSYNKFLGEKFKSESVKALSIDSRNDVLTTLAVLIGLLIQIVTKFNHIDDVLGIIISIIIFISGMSLLKNTVSPLLGEKADEELVANLADIAKENKNVIDIHDIVVHSYGGNKIFATMHIGMSSNTELLFSHKVADLIEKKAKEKYSVEMVIHVDPVEEKNEIARRIYKGLENIDIKVQAMNDEIESFKFHDLQIMEKGQKTEASFDIQISPDSAENREIILEELRLEFINDNGIEIKPSFDEMYVNNI